MLKKLLLVTSVAILLGACAKVPMEDIKASNEAKQFNPPSSSHSGLYIYRDSFMGQALKKDIWVDDQCIGESAPDTFFYVEVDGGKEHKISTESEFSPNDLYIQTETGKNYFVRQYIRIGLFVGGANLELIDDEEGKKDVSNLGLAKRGACTSK